MDISKQTHGSTFEVKMRGKFTFSDRQIFRDITQEIQRPEIKKVVLDFSGVEFVDSAALGVLLLTKDEAEKHDTTLILRKPVDQVQKMFKISCFYDLFRIED
jgi:anti-anti-sigma factor